MFIQRFKGNLKGNKGLKGCIELLYDGLITGWVTCPRCLNEKQCLPSLLVDRKSVETSLNYVKRDDVPGGVGFTLRFQPIGGQNPSVQIACAAHLEAGYVSAIGGDTWSAQGIASIESSNWPEISGWVISFGEEDPICELVLEGFDSCFSRCDIRRPDLEMIFGRKGVAGFRVDVGGELGHALPDKSRIELLLGGVLLAESKVIGSPLSPLSEGCIPAGRGQSLTSADLARLRTRFREVEASTLKCEWREALAELGFDDHSSETEQWANYLAHHNMSINQIAIWLAAHYCDRLGIDAISPLPRGFEIDLQIDYPVSGPTLVKWRADSFREAACNVSNRSEYQSDGEEKIIVAGLVNHRSGLGQHARLSQQILESLDLHTCTAEFLPSPGGWNPRLLARPESLAAIREHSVLLHLPIDAVVNSLVVQPALLATDRLIGFFYWEMEWVPRPLHLGLHLMDEIWVATNFVAKAIRNVTSTPVHVVGNAVDVSQVELVKRSELGISEDAFVVHFSFDANSTVVRKNPSGAIDAFLLATEGDPSAVFLLKVRNFEQVRISARRGDAHARMFLEKVSKDPRIKLLTAELDYSRALGLIQLSDCYLSLHRSEGYGYGMAEARALGVPVIATGYSGNLDFMSDSSAKLVPYDSRAVLPDEYFYWESEMHWAEPDVVVASEHLQTLINRGRRMHDVSEHDFGNSMEHLRGAYRKLLHQSA